MTKRQRFIAGLLPLLAGWAWAQDPIQARPSGPAAQSGKSVVFIASDFKNGGAMAVYRGFEEAAKKLGWKISLEDGQGHKTTQAVLLTKAIASTPDGIVFGGFEPGDFAEQVARAKRSKTVLLGWHAAKEPGATPELFVNVSTRPVDVTHLAADFVIQDAIAKKRPVGVVIFNDNQYAVANAKTEAMRQTIQACQGYAGCKVLAVENVLISDAAAAMPAAVSKLIATHGSAWTYSLAINDVYFDEINYPLLLAKRTDILNVSAGEGSSKALGRIGAGVSQQVATVAEPLKMQGYQLADELNRALAGAPPSGLQSQPILVTTALLKATGSRGIESALGFEAAYWAIWSKK
jgi:ribose transport system substrate-binding protein